MVRDCTKPAKSKKGLGKIEVNSGDSQTYCPNPVNSEKRLDMVNINCGDSEKDSKNSAKSDKWLEKVVRKISQILRTKKGLERGIVKKCKSSKI